MQVVVRRSDLTSPQPLVLASYDDTVVVDVTALGLDKQSATVLGLPASALAAQERGPPLLASSWRDNAVAIVNAEAFRRIERVFTSYAQRNANADMTNCITKYGPDPGDLAGGCARSQDDGRSGLDLRQSVRQQANAMATALPPDPTDDSHWPTEIPRINYPIT